MNDSFGVGWFVRLRLQVLSTWRLVNECCRFQSVLLFFFSNVCARRAVRAVTLNRKLKAFHTMHIRFTHWSCSNNIRSSNSNSKLEWDGWQICECVCVIKVHSVNVVCVFFPIRIPHCQFKLNDDDDEDDDDDDVDGVNRSALFTYMRMRCGDTLICYDDLWCRGSVFNIVRWISKIFASRTSNRVQPDSHHVITMCSCDLVEEQ